MQTLIKFNTGAYMAAATTASKGLSKVEMKLLNDFANTVNAREFSENVTIQKLSLTYDIDEGFTVNLEETKNEVAESTS